MNYLTKIYMLLAIIFFPIQYLDAQWIPISLPSSANIRCLFETKGNIFAGTYGDGIFSSSNKGQNWSAVSTGLSNYYVNALVEYDMYLFAGTGGNGVYRSSDNGNHWTEANTGINTVNVTSLVATESSLVAGTSSGIYISTDHGGNWVLKLNSGGSSLGKVGSILFAGTYQGAYKSVDRGFQWQKISFGLGNTFVYAFAAIDSHIFAGTSEGVFLSTNEGDSWTPVNNNLGNTGVNDVKASGTFLFAGTYGGIFVSSNYGGTWTERNSGVTNNAVSCLSMSGPVQYAGTYGNGIYESENNGQNWKESNVGFPVVAFEVVTIQDSLILGAKNGSIHITADNGTSWKSRLTHYITSFAISGKRIFAGTWNHGIILSSDHGEIWSEANNDLIRYENISMLAIQDTMIYAGGENSMYMTSNSDINFASVDVGSHISAIVTGGDNTFAESYSGLFRSTDHGIHWTEVKGDMPSLYPRTGIYTAIDSVMYIGTSYGISFIYPDNQIWKNGTAGLSDQWITVLTVHGKDLIAGTKSGKVFLSTNGGQRWDPMDLGLDGSPIRFVVADSEKIFVLNQGLYYRPLSEMVTAIREQQRSNSHEYSLEQNYPNPFNPRTTINYLIPMTSHVNLDIYNMVGQKIRSLVNEEKPAGSYAETFDATDLPSGIYFCRISTGDYVHTIKLVLLK